MIWREQNLLKVVMHQLLAKLRSFAKALNENRKLRWWIIAFDGLAIIFIVCLMIWMADEWYWRITFSVLLFVWILQFALDTIYIIFDARKPRSPGA